MKQFKATDNSKGLFCSRSCAAIVNNSKFPKRKSLNKKHCLNCNESLNSTQKKYCNNKCQNKFIKRNKIKKWLSGDWDPTNKDGSLSTTVRNYLMEEAGFKCQCGWNEVNPYTGIVPLTINHKDGNSHNNTSDNLEVLCWNCHSLTPNFGSLNKGNGKRITYGMRMAAQRGFDPPTPARQAGMIASSPLGQEWLAL